MRNTDKYERLTIEEKACGATYRDDSGFTVYGHGTYPKSSVLAGQSSRNFLGKYDTIAEAKLHHPTATFSGSTYQPMSSIAPAWCTPAYEAETGERWEDD